MTYEPPSAPPPGGYGGSGVPGGGSPGGGGFGGPGGYPGGPAGGYGGGPAGPPPQNYLVWAILSTILCCLPAGIASIIFATQVNSKWQMGDAAGAMESSRKAKMWAMISAGLALVGAVIYVIFFVLLAANSGTTTS